MRYPLRWLLAAIGAVLAVAPAAVAQEAQPTPVVTAHAVDATRPEVAVTLFADGVGVGVGDVMVVENDETVSGARLSLASTEGRPAELVFVIDTSESVAIGFDQLTAALAESIESLPSGTTVAVVAAGGFPRLVQPATTDLGAAASSVRQLTLTNGVALWDALDRGLEQFTTGSGPVRTIVAVSGSPDESRRAGLSGVRAGLIRQGAQIVGVTFPGGDARLGQLATAAGGTVLPVDGDVRDTIRDAVRLGRDRVVLRYPTALADGELATVRIGLGPAETALSFTAGSQVDRISGLAVVTPPSDGFAGGFLRSSTGLYALLALSVLGVTLAVFSLGSILLGREESLDGVLSRYSAEATAEGEDAGTHSAFMRRAVSMTEDLARDRGLLAKTEAALEKANLPLRAGEALFGWAAVAVLVSVASLLLSQQLLPALVVAVLALGAPFFVVKLRIVQRQRKFETQLPDALQLLAGTLRAGYSLPQGMEAVSREIEDPMGFELRRVMTEAQLGRELEEALEAAAERLGSEDFAWAVMAIGIQREVGGNLNELLMTVADTMIARERLRGEIKTLTAEGKLSAIILGGLPPAIGAVMYAMNPDYIGVLFSETLGNIFMGLAVVAGGVGLLWMKKVITIDV
jgi:tight adherence protein B